VSRQDPPNCRWVLSRPIPIWRNSMRKQFSPRILVAMLFFCALATAVVAADRTIWKHDRGTFTKAKGDTWLVRGTDKDAKAFVFKETNRTDEYVELHSEVRKISIRLKDKVCLIQEEAGKPYKQLYTGGWVDKYARST